MERISRKLIAVGLFVGLGMSACTAYDPEDNEFVLEGIVTDTGKQSLKIEVTQIIVEEGKAKKFFDIGDVDQVHDNYPTDEGFFGSTEKVGTVYNYDGLLINIVEVDEGSCVSMQGQIREYSDGDETKYRADFNKAQIVDC